MFCLRLQCSVICSHANGEPDIQLICRSHSGLNAFWRLVFSVFLPHLILFCSFRLPSFFLRSFSAHTRRRSKCTPKWARRFTCVLRFLRATDTLSPPTYGVWAVCCTSCVPCGRPSSQTTKRQADTPSHPHAQRQLKMLGSSTTTIIRTLVFSCPSLGVSGSQETSCIRVRERLKTVVSFTY